MIVKDLKHLEMAYSPEERCLFVSGKQGSSLVEGKIRIKKSYFRSIVAFIVRIWILGRK